MSAADFGIYRVGFKDYRVKVGGVELKFLSVSAAMKFLRCSH